MFYCLNGTLIHKDTACAVIDCGGVGFLCRCSLNTVKKLPKIDENVFLFTHLSVKEDALDLYGFADRAELDCFKLLIGVSGVGAKSALSVLSELDSDKFALCVAAGDYKRLQKAQGIGQKTAQRIVLELKDKVGGVGGGNAELIEAITAETGNAMEEAIAALVSLGYGRTDAAAAVAKYDRNMPVEDMIRHGLKELSGRFKI